MRIYAGLGHRDIDTSRTHGLGGGKRSFRKMQRPVAAWLIVTLSQGHGQRSRISHDKRQ